MQNPRSILITGASSGLGAALAEEYAGDGVTLALGGRDGKRLEDVAGRCRARGAEVAVATVDVTDAAALADWIGESDRRAPLDLVIANAGISGGTGGGEGQDQTRHIFAVNVDGVINTALPAVRAMRERGRGQIALISSIAAFRGFPGAPAYCASKAAVKHWGEGLRGSLWRDGIVVSVVCPGFVRTPMTDVNPFPMPMLMDAAPAAAIIRRGLARGRARIAFPLPMYVLAWFLGILPPRLTDPLFRRLPEKSSLPEKI